MKIKWIKFRILLLVSFALTATIAFPKSGDGLIYSEADWLAISTNKFAWAATFSLGADITLSSEKCHVSDVHWISEDRYDPDVDGFCGTLNGNGHSITLAGDLASYSHLFSNPSNATFKSVTLSRGSIDLGLDCKFINCRNIMADQLENCNITNCWGTCANWLENCVVRGHLSESSDPAIGSLANNAFGCMFEDCSAAVAIEEITDDLGGLIKRAENCKFTRCMIVGSVEGDWSVGGFVGYGASLEFSNCTANVTLNGDSRIGGFVGCAVDCDFVGCRASIDIVGESEIGGLVGSFDDGHVTNCVTLGVISGSGQDIGGLIGWGSFVDCYDSSSSVAPTGGMDVGGCVGLATDGGSYVNCKATGSIAGVEGAGCLGGFVGYATGMEFRNCLSTGDVQGPGNSLGGFAGHVGDGCTVTGCAACGEVQGSGMTSVGGFVGDVCGVRLNGSGNVSIRKCHSVGSALGGTVVGGFAGALELCSVSDCYSSGAATADGQTFSAGGFSSTSASVGGFAGKATLNAGAAMLSRCYACGRVTTIEGDAMAGVVAAAGGLTPLDVPPEIYPYLTEEMVKMLMEDCDSCYWDVTTTGQKYSGRGVGITTAQAGVRSTYVGWDFEGTWRMEDGRPVLLGVRGCEAEPPPPDDPEDPEDPCKPRVSQTSLHFGCGGGRIDLGVESKMKWNGTKLSGDSGCTFSASSGDGDATLTVSVTSNRTESARSWSWQISSDCGVATIEITQEACKIPDPECPCAIDIGASLVVFGDCKADFKRVSVTSSGSWSSSVRGGTGLTVTSAGSAGDSVAVFTVTENTTGKLREWDVVFTGHNECGDECSTTVHVTQGTCLPECEISVDPGLVTFGCGRGGKTVQIKASRSWSAQKLSGDADCTLSSASGAGDATLTISVSSNRTESARSWSWQIASDCGVATLEVRQEACNPDCACSIDTDTLLVEFESCEADSRQINVTSSVNWSSRVNGGAGLSVTSSGLKGESTAVFTVSENMTGNPREWDVVFTGRTECGDECSTTVHVTQGTCQLGCRIRVTPSERVVNANWHFGFLTVTANDSWTLDAKSVPRWIAPLLRSGPAGTWCVPYIVRAQPDCGSGDAADSRRASLRFVNARGCSDTFILEQLGRECCTFLSIYREGEEQCAFTTNGAAFSLSLKVRSSSAWAAVSEADWIRVAEANQETNVLTLEVLANPGEERRGEVRVTNVDGDERIFTILQTPETVAVDPEYVLLSPEAGEAIVAIRSSADWTVRIPDDARPWLSVSPDSGSGDGTITISVESNAGDDLRFAELSVAAGLIEKELLVVQDTAVTRLGITGPDSMRSDGTAENLCVVVSPGYEAEPVSPTWSVTGPDGIRIGTDGTVALDGILLTQAVATVTAQYAVDGKELVASREIEILPKPGPGVWTTDVTAALAGAKGDGRLILALASKYETCRFCQLFEPVAQNPEFLKWAHDNGVYLIAATRSGPCGESVTDEYFWTLTRSFGHTGSVSLPSLAFAYPSDLYQGVGLDTGRVGNTIGTVEYDGTVVTLIEGVASYLKSRTAQTFAEALGVPELECVPWGSTKDWQLRVDPDWTCDGNGAATVGNKLTEWTATPGFSFKVTGPTQMKFSYSKSFSSATFSVDCTAGELYRDDTPGEKTDWKQVVLDIPAGEQSVYFKVRLGDAALHLNDEYEYNGFWIDDLQFDDLGHETVYKIGYDNDYGFSLVNPVSYVASDLPIRLSDPVPLKSGYTFVGWSMNGKMVTEIPKGTTGNIQLVAVWNDSSLDEGGNGDGTNGVSRLYETVDLKYIWPKPYVGAAAVYDGYLSDADGIVRGTIQVKVAKGKTDRKTGKFAAKVTATVQMANEPKKISFKGGVVDSDVRGLVSAMSAGGHVLNAQVGEYGLGGTMDGLTIDGARNVFTGKYEGDGAFADAASGCMGVYNLAGEGGVLSVSVAKKGKVKISGTVNGAKVSATSQLLVGNEVCCIPIVIAKKASLALNLLITKDGKDVVVRGTDSSSWTAGKAGQLAGVAKFSLADNGAPGARVLPGLYGEYLPNGVDVSANGTKWVVAGGVKAGKVAFVKGGNTVDQSKLQTNPSGLKLTYKQKDGTFKGSFKAYCLEGGKIKAYTASVTGVMIGAKGYGTATIKKPFVSFSAAIE